MMAGMAHQANQETTLLQQQKIKQQLILVLISIYYLENFKSIIIFDMDIFIFNKKDKNYSL